MISKNKLAIVTSFPPGTGIFRFADNLAHFGFFSNTLYFKSLANKLMANSPAEYKTIAPNVIPEKLSYILSFHFPSNWSKEIEKYSYVHVVSPDFFHLSRFKKSIIGTVHDLYFLNNDTRKDYTWYYRFFEKRDLDYCYNLLGLTTISKNTDKLLNHFYPKIKSKVIHHWTPDYFSKIDRINCRDTLSIPKSKFVLLNVSFNSSNKNLEFLGNLMDSLSNDYLLIHIGNSDILCKNPDRVLNINKYLEDQALVKYYNSADLYLAPSTSEGFNYPVIEALNCGIPVLGSDIEIFKEVLMNSPYLIQLDLLKWKETILSLNDKKAYKNATEWYSFKIGDYYREERGKTQFMDFYDSLGVNI